MWEVIFREIYPEDSNRKTRLYSQVIDPEIPTKLELRNKFIRKLRNRYRKKSKYSNASRNGRFSNLSGSGGSKNK